MISQEIEQVRSSLKHQMSIESKLKSHLSSKQKYDYLQEPEIILSKHSPNSLTQPIEVNKAMITGQSEREEHTQQNSNRYPSSRAANQDIIHLRSHNSGSQP